jgi:hypothetical protein
MNGDPGRDRLVGEDDICLVRSSGPAGARCAANTFRASTPTGSPTTRVPMRCATTQSTTMRAASWRAWARRRRRCQQGFGFQGSGRSLGLSNTT